MSYCINPNCRNRQQPNNLQSCQDCGTELLINGRYRLVNPLRDLDSSLYIEVFEVDDRGTLKVLKVLKTNQHKYAELFEQEARILTRLRHSGIPQAELDGDFSFGLSNGRELRCLVMEKIEGKNLEQWLQTNQRIFQDYLALLWLRQLVKILDYVHHNGFFHRDIKPSNIMLKPDGQLVLIDFGTARQITQTVIDGRAVTAVYSCGYTATEQIEARAVPQSDFFALGRTFVHLVTGQHPEDLPKDSQSRQLNWRDSAPQISASLANFIDELMAPSVENRPHDTTIIWQRINELEDSNLPVPAIPTLPPPASSTVTEPPPRPRLHWWVVIFGFLSLLLNLLLLWIIAQGRRPVVSTLKPCDSPAIKAARLKHESDVNAIAYSPNGKQVATASLDNTARVWEVKGGKQIACLPHKDSVVAVAFSPNGKYLATASLDKTVQVRDMSRGSIIPLQHKNGVMAVAFSPNGEYLATASADGNARIWDTTRGRRVALLPHNAYVRTVVFSSDGRYLATASLDNTARVWETTSGKQVKLLPHQERVVAVAFSPDGRYLATGGANGTAQVWEWKRANNQSVANLAHKGSVVAVAFTPDEKYLVTASANGTAQVWEWKVTPSPKVMPVPQNEVVAVDLSRDGKYLATTTANGTAQVWDTINVKNLQNQYKNALMAVAFSPDGQFLAIASRDDTIQLWDWQGSNPR